MLRPRSLLVLDERLALLVLLLLLDGLVLLVAVAQLESLVLVFLFEPGPRFEIWFPWFDWIFSTVMLMLW